MSNHTVKIVNGRKVHSFTFSLSDLKHKLEEVNITEYSIRTLSEAMKLPSITEAVNHVKYNTRGRR